MHQSQVQQKIRKVSLPRALWRAILLKCIYCGQTSFLGGEQQRHQMFSKRLPKFLTFNQGCAACDYPFEREDGYYTGASWMLSYAIGSLSGFATAGLMLWRDLNGNLALVIGTAIVVGGGVALLTIPFARTLWLLLDHIFHPLEEFETLARRQKS